MTTREVIQARADNIETLTNSKIGGAGLLEQTARALQVIARELHSADEFACNYDIGDEESESYRLFEAREQERMTRAARLVAPAGFSVYHQSDCRGWSLYLYRQSDVDAYQTETRERNTRAGEPERWIGGIDSIYSSIGIGVCSS